MRSKKAPKCKNARKHTWERVGGLEENPGVFDTGNGAIKTISQCKHCGTTRINVSSYCGRTRDNGTWYSLPPLD